MHWRRLQTGLTARDVARRLNCNRMTKARLAAIYRHTNSTLLPRVATPAQDHYITVTSLPADIQDVGDSPRTTGTSVGEEWPPPLKGCRTDNHPDKTCVFCNFNFISLDCVSSLVLTAFSKWNLFTKLSFLMAINTFTVHKAASQVSLLQSGGDFLLLFTVFWGVMDSTRCSKC